VPQRLTISRRSLFRTGLGAAAALGGIPRGRSQDEVQLPFILFVHCDGGWDPTMVLDPKLDSLYVDAEPGAALRRTAAGLPYVDHAGRPGVRDFFSVYGDGAAIINGLNAGSMLYENALVRELGAVPPRHSTPVDWLSFFVSMLNPVLDLPHAVIDAPFMPGDFAGVAVRMSRQDVADAVAATNATPTDVATLGTAGETALAAFRRSAYDPAFVGKAGKGTVDAEKLAALYYSEARAGAVRTRTAEVAKTLGEQGSDSDLLRSGKIAVELFAAGASQCATIQAGGDRLFDTSTDHYARQTSAFEMLFTGLSGILDYAGRRSVRQQLLVIVTSERGRSPRLDARGGKGPWPTTSALVWGTGIQGGTVVAASDAALRAVPFDPLFGGTPETKDGSALELAHLMAAIYLQYGVPLPLILPDYQPLALVMKAAEE
jgi:hypothetical protein